MGVDVAAAAAAAAAATTTAAEKKAADAGLDVPISSVVNADVYDCDGNIVPIANLTAPIVFTLQIDAALLGASTVQLACPGASGYLPNDGEIDTLTQVVTKKIECSYVDADTGQFRSDGCEQVGDINFDASGDASVTCACTHLTEFAILLREAGSADESACNLSPSSVFGSIVFLVFAVLFALVLTFGVRQTYFIFFAFALNQKTMLIQHVLLCLICIFRIVVCVIYYLLQYESVQAAVEFKAVAVLASIPYICLLWLCSLLVSNWAAIFYAAMANNMHQMSTAFSQYRLHFIAVNVVASLILFSSFVALALSTDADERKLLTTFGSVFFASLAVLLSLSFLRYGYGLLVVLTKDFASKSATRLFKVGIVFAVCFLGEAVIWLYSATAPVSFFASFEAIMSTQFSFDIIALLCTLAVSFRTLRDEVNDKKELAQRGRGMRLKKRRVPQRTNERASTETSYDGSKTNRVVKFFRSRRGSMTGHDSGSRRGSDTSGGSRGSRTDASSIGAGSRGDDSCGSKIGFNRGSSLIKKRRKRIAGASRHQRNIGGAILAKFDVPSGKRKRQQRKEENGVFLDPDSALFDKALAKHAADVRTETRQREADLERELSINPALLNMGATNDVTTDGSGTDVVIDIFADTDGVFSKSGSASYSFLSGVSSVQTSRGGSIKSRERTRSSAMSLIFSSRSSKSSTFTSSMSSTSSTSSISSRSSASSTSADPLSGEEGSNSENGTRVTRNDVRRAKEGRLDKSAGSSISSISSISSAPSSFPSSLHFSDDADSSLLASDVASSLFGSDVSDLSETYQTSDQSDVRDAW
jgi:hypothetical protein